MFIVKGLLPLTVLRRVHLIVAVCCPWKLSVIPFSIIYSTFSMSMEITCNRSIESGFWKIWYDDADYFKNNIYCGIWNKESQLST